MRAALLRVQLLRRDLGALLLRRRRVLVVLLDDLGGGDHVGAHEAAQRVEVALEVAQVAQVLEGGRAAVAFQLAQRLERARELPLLGKVA